MILEGTLVNMAAIGAGTLLGRGMGRFLSEPIRRTLMAGLGLSVVLIGIQLSLQTRQPLVVIASLVLGGLAGELLEIEKRLDKFGEGLQKRMGGSNVAKGFVTATLLYCVGAMAVTGSIQDGFGDTPTILYAKSALDGLAAIALSSALGIGVLFSALPLLAYQGSLTLLAESARAILTDPVMAEMNAVGGLLILAIGLDLLEVKRLPVGNLLPAIFVAPFLIWIIG